MQGPGSYNTTRKDQDEMKCLACMDKIMAKLGNLGLSFFMTSDKKNILCKTYGYVSFDAITGGATTNTPSSSTTTCPHSIAGSPCPYTICKYPNAQCHYHSALMIGNASNNTSDEDLTCNRVVGCLFRITPTDIYNGIFLHVIKLHGEKCDLKMTFNMDDSGASELVNLIQFLVE